MRECTYFEVAKAFYEHTEMNCEEVNANILEKCLFRPGSYRRELLEEHEAEEIERRLTLQNPNMVAVPQALSMLLFQRLSKRQYIYIRDVVNNASRVKMLPSYNQVFLCKQLCRPQLGIEVTEAIATVTVRWLVDHTVRRILEAFEDIDSKLIQNESQRRSVEFVFSYGYYYILHWYQ